MFCCLLLQNTMHILQNLPLRGYFFENTENSEIMIDYETFWQSVTGLASQCTTILYSETSRRGGGLTNLGSKHVNKCVFSNVAIL